MDKSATNTNNFEGESLESSLLNRFSSKYLLLLNREKDPLYNIFTKIIRQHMLKHAAIMLSTYEARHINTYIGDMNEICNKITPQNISFVVEYDLAELDKAQEKNMWRRGSSHAPDTDKENNVNNRNNYWKNKPPLKNTMMDNIHLPGLHMHKQLRSIKLNL